MLTIYVMLYDFYIALYFSLMYKLKCCVYYAAVVTSGNYFG